MFMDVILHIAYTQRQAHQQLKHIILLTVHLNTHNEDTHTQKRSSDGQQKAEQREFKSFLKKLIEH